MQSMTWNCTSDTTTKQVCSIVCWFARNMLCVHFFAWHCERTACTMFYWSKGQTLPSPLQVDAAFQLGTPKWYPWLNTGGSTSPSLEHMRHVTYSFSIKSYILHQKSGGILFQVRMGYPKYIKRVRMVSQCKSMPFFFQLSVFIITNTNIEYQTQIFYVVV